MNVLRKFLAGAWLALFAFAAQGSVPGLGNFGFGDLEHSLRLDPAQKAQFDVAVAATQRALISVALVGVQMKDRIGTELSKPRPDLDALARAQDDAIEQTRPLFREAHVEWARLYAMLDAGQVRIARAYVEDRLEMFERATRSTLEQLSRQLRPQ
jgi:hypothetical protein